MTHEDYLRAQNYWKDKEPAGKALDREALMEAMEKYIRVNNTCALATGTGNFIRCTPIEYSYHDGCFWMFSEGGEKFIGLEKNPNVCLAIYDKFTGFQTLNGMQIMGEAVVVEPFSEEYNSHAAYQKISLEKLKKMNPPMNLIKVIPKNIEFLSSEFQKLGYASRQKLTP